MGYYLKISFDIEKRVVNSKVLFCENEGIRNKLNFFYDSLSCSLIDIVPYSDSIDLVVDDEGLYKSYNPVFQIPNELYVDDLNVVGSFIIGLKKENSDGTTTEGFNSEAELWEAIRDSNFKVKVIGVTD